MKACIKVSTIGKFTQSQQDIIRRIMNVLEDHNLSVKIEYKTKKVTTPKLKVV
jgi:hypothetical protein